MKAPWLTPGNRIAGLNLATVSPLSVETEGKTINGVVLQYRSQPSTPASPSPGTRADQRFDEPELTIQQTAQPDEPRAWNRIPTGSVAIQTGETSDSGGTHSTWTAMLVRNGIYVTIETQRSEATVLAVARALRPAP